MKRFIFWLVLFTCCPVIAQERDPDDGSEPPITWEDVEAVKELADAEKQTAHLYHSSAEASLTALGLGVASGNWGDKPTISGQWDEWEDEGFVVPKWAKDDLAHQTDVVKGQLAGDLAFPVSAMQPNGTNSTIYLLQADLDYNAGNELYNDGSTACYAKFYSASDFYYLAAYGEMDEASGESTGGASRVYEDSEAALAVCYDIEYTVAMMYWYGY